jgi:hypothetical protein
MVTIFIRWNNNFIIFAKVRKNCKKELFDLIGCQLLLPYTPHFSDSVGQCFWLKMQHTIIRNNCLQIEFYYFYFFQDSNPFLKQNLQRSEDLAFWLKQKTDDFVTSTNLKEPLKRLDSAAANGLDNLEKARLKVKQVLSLIHSVTKGYLDDG